MYDTYAGTLCMGKLIETSQAEAHWPITAQEFSIGDLQSLFH